MLPCYFQVLLPTIFQVAATQRSFRPRAANVITLVASIVLLLGLWAALVPPRWPQHNLLLIPAALAQAAALLFQPTWYGTLCTLVCLAWWTWRNRSNHGLMVVGIGTLLNLSVMLASHGAMPISVDVLQRLGADPTVHSLLAGSKDVVVPSTYPLWWLGDCIPVRIGQQYIVASIGDVTLAVGLLWWMLGTTIAQVTKRKPAVRASVRPE